MMSEGRRLILHVGVQKTGTTSIQRFLKLRASELADCLIVRTPEEGTPMRPLGRAAVALSLSGQKDDREALRAAFDDVLDTVPDGPQPVILSHENLAGAMPGNGGETRLYPALPRILKILDKSAQARGFSCDVVLYTRQMLSWRPSVWAQAVRTDGYAGTFEEFMEATADLPEWDDLVDRVRAVLGPDRVTRLRLEEETDLERPGRQLLAHAGIEAARIDALAPLEDAAMKRLNGGSTEFLRQVNALALNPHARGRIADLVARTQHLFTADAPSEGTL